VLLLLLVFALVNAAVLVLRRDPVDQPHFRVPTAVPVVGAVVSLGLTATKSPTTFLRTGALLLLGAALAGVVAWRHRREADRSSTGAE
jgi:basic amino acid/polyamine antiporter, APA family